MPPFPEREGGATLNATISHFAWGSVRARDDSQVNIHSADLDLSVSYGAHETPALDGRLDLAMLSLKRFDIRGQGLDIFLQSDAPPGSGLGSSSALVVTLVALLREALRIPLTDFETSELAHHIERLDLGIAGGRQDQYAATFGGFSYMEFIGDKVVVNPLRINPSVLNELEHNLVLCFTQTTRQSDLIISDQTSRYVRGDHSTVDGLRRQKELALIMKNLLLEYRLDEFGRALHEAWETKKRLSTRISTTHIDDLYETARLAGALGGKVLGAGGGGFMLFYCPFEKRHMVAEAVSRKGAQVARFTFEPNGVQTWRVG